MLLTRKPKNHVLSSGKKSSYIQINSQSGGSTFAQTCFGGLLSPYEGRSGDFFGSRRKPLMEPPVCCPIGVWRWSGDEIRSGKNRHYGRWPVLVLRGSAIWHVVLHKRKGKEKRKRKTEDTSTRHPSILSAHNKRAISTDAFSNVLPGFHSLIHPPRVWLLCVVGSS